MYKRTVYLFLEKKYLAFGKGKKIPSNEKGTKIPIKKIHIAQLQTLFRVPNLWYELWLIQSEGSLHGLNSVCP